MKGNHNIKVAAADALNAVSTAVAGIVTIGPLSSYLARQGSDPACDAEVRAELRAFQDNADLFLVQMSKLAANLSRLANVEVVIA